MTGMASDPAMGNSGYERVEDDFYPTPAWMTQGLLDLFANRGGTDSPIRFDAPWWEPACGQGHIAEVVKEAVRGEAHTTDLIDRGYGTGGVDFLAQVEAPKGVEMIWTNPPYGALAKEFVVHALDLMKPVNGSVIMLMRNEYDCSKTRMHLFKGHPAYFGKAVSTTRPRWIEGTTGSPRHNYAWYLWDWRSSNQEPRIFYFNKK